MNKKFFAMAAIACLAVFAAGQSAFSDVRVENVRYSPYPATPGQYATLYFDLYNAGNVDANSVAFTISQKYPFSLEPGDSATNTLNTLTAGGRVTLQYRLRIDPNAVDGPNGLPYVLKFSQQQTSASITLQVAGANNLRISKVTPSLIKPGQETSLTFTVQNAGKSTIEGITLAWDEATKLIIPVGSDNRRYIPALKPGEQADADFDIIADPGIAPGAYVINANLSYAGTNSTQSVFTKVGIVVGGDADLEVTEQDYSAGQLSLAIANTGTTPASAVSLTIPRQQGIAVSGPTTQFVGNLLKGDFTIATFQLQQAGQDGTRGPRQANFTGSIKTIVAYTNTLGERKSLEQEIPLDAGVLTGAPGAGRFRQQGLPWYAYAIGALVLIAAGWIAYKRFKKPNPVGGHQQH